MQDLASPQTEARPDDFPAKAWMAWVLIILQLIGSIFTWFTQYVVDGFISILGICIALLLLPLSMVNKNLANIISSFTASILTFLHGVFSWLVPIYLLIKGLIFLVVKFVPPPVMLTTTVVIASGIGLVVAINFLVNRIDIQH